MNSWKSFPATLEAISEIKNYILDRISNLNVSKNKQTKIILAVEELIVNIINYANMKKPEIIIDINKDSYKLILKIVDYGEPFNPLEVEEPDISLGIEERQIGGLGIFLVKKVVDDIYYKREDDKNCIVLIFNLES